MKVHVFDWRWGDENTAEVQAIAGDKFGRKQFHVGTQISIAPQGERHCAGNRVDGVWSPCSSSDYETKPKCALCRSKEGSFVYTAFDGFDTSQLNPGDIEKMQKPHCVYLALFAPGILKIGVSSEHRKTMRQIEQGSHATLYVAHVPDGITARQIETTARRAGLNDKILSRQKKDVLHPDMTAEEAKSELMASLPVVQDSLESMPNLQSYLLDEPEFFSWAEHFNLPFGTYIPVKLKSGESVSGTIVGVKGAFVVIDTGTELVSLCMKDFIGFEVDFTPKAPGLLLETALQNALF